MMMGWRYNRLGWSVVRPDGRLMLVEATAEGGLPRVVLLDQAGSFVGGADKPAPRAVHSYVRDQDLDGLATYRYVGVSD